MSYRLSAFANILDSEWSDWTWQHRHAVRSMRQIQGLFPNFPREIGKHIERIEQRLRFLLTPYLLSLFELDEQGNPKQDDPLFLQFFPHQESLASNAFDEYDGEKENWELPEECPTPILQHKYPNRVVFRMANTCLGFCMYCFEAKRTLDKQSRKGFLTPEVWQQSLEYIRKHSEIEDVVLSGGEPLVLTNELLEQYLSDIRMIPHIRVIRIDTRAFTFNPFRIDDGLVACLKKHRVTTVILHMTHPNEITKDFLSALLRLQSIPGLLMLGHTPLIKGVNDSVETLRELFLRLFELGVKPYYLLHDMPFIPAAAVKRTSVKKGVELMLKLKRFISNLAVPEYIIVHTTGKKTVPLELDGTPEFQYTKNTDGQPIARFKDWKGNWEGYPDGTD